MLLQNSRIADHRFPDVRFLRVSRGDGMERVFRAHTIIFPAPVPISQTLRNQKLQHRNHQALPRVTDCFAGKHTAAGTHCAWRGVAFGWRQQLAICLLVGLSDGHGGKSDANHLPSKRLLDPPSARAACYITTGLHF